MKLMELFQAAANHLCSRHVEIIHCRALKAVVAREQHKADFLCRVPGPGLLTFKEPDTKLSEASVLCSSGYHVS